MAVANNYFECLIKEHSEESRKQWNTKINELHNAINEPAQATQVDCNINFSPENNCPPQVSKEQQELYQSIYDEVIKHSERSSEVLQGLCDIFIKQIKKKWLNK